jgi:hypothetical protein
MPDCATVESLAVRRWRESRREEWDEHIHFAELAAEYLDPETTFWSSLENKPITPVSGLFQKRRGVRSGLTDVLVLVRHAGGTLVIFIELKSKRGRVSRIQKQVRAEMLPTGAVWWMARTARAALMALHRSGASFRRKYKPPKLKPWEGPFADPTQRLPQHPSVAKERREEKRRYRLRKQIRAREAAQRAAKRDGAGLIDARVTTVSAGGHGRGTRHAGHGPVRAAQRAATARYEGAQTLDVQR